MNYFLQGESGIGKSYLLQEVLTEYASILEGFTVQRLYLDEKFMGFRACVFQGKFEGQIGEYQPDQSGIFISPKGRDLSILEDMILQVKDRCLKPSCQIVVLDEIGGIELVSQRFMNALYAILNSGKFCVGVLKSRPNLDRTLKNHGTDNDYLTSYEQLVCHINKTGQLETMTGDNREELRLRLRNQIRINGTCKGI